LSFCMFKFHFILFLLFARHVERNTRKHRT
jgi:hypothetical protein